MPENAYPPSSSSFPRIVPRIFPEGIFRELWGEHLHYTSSYCIEPVLYARDAQTKSPLKHRRYILRIVCPSW